MRSIYELTGDMLNIQDMMESEEELNDEDLAALFDEVSGDYNLKMENCCRVIKNLENSITGLKAESDRLTERRKSIENNIKRLKTTMFESMKVTGTDKIYGETFNLAIQKNGGKAPLILNVAVEGLPDELVRIEKKPNNDAIREYIKETGDMTYAELGEIGESLRIR